VRVDARLEHVGREGLLGGGGALDVLVAREAVHRLLAGGWRHQLDHRVEQRRDARGARAAREVDGAELAGGDRAAQPVVELGLREIALGEVRLGEVVVGAGHVVDEPRAPRLGGLLVRPRGVGLGAGRVGLAHEGPVRAQRDDALVRVPLAHAQLEQRRGHLEARLHVGRGVERRRVLGVDLGHHHQHGQPLVTRPREDALGDGLHAILGRHGEQHGVDRAQREARLGEEAALARGVDHVDLRPVPGEAGDARLERREVLSLFDGVVEHARLVVDSPELGGRLGHVEHGFHERRLAAPLVPDDRNVSNVARRCHGPEGSAPAPRATNGEGAPRGRDAALRHRRSDGCEGALVKLTRTVATIALNLALPVAFVVWDRRRLAPDVRARAWNGASFGAAVYAFGVFSMLGWGVVTRRGLRGLGFGALVTLAGLALIVGLDVLLERALPPHLR
jgi:hypothetical protein